MGHVFSKIWTNLVIVVLIAGAYLLGMGLVREGTTNRKFAAMPVTPLSELGRFAGTGKMVRVRAKALGEPALGAPGDRALALQAVRVQHDETSWNGEETETETITDYERILPEQMWVGDGDTRVRVKTKGVAYTYLDPSAEEEVQTKGRMPAAVASVVAREFTGIPLDRKGATIEVWSAARGEEVTIFGAVTLENGQPVLQASPHIALFLVSPLPVREIEKRVGVDSIVGIAFGVFLLLGALAATGYFGLRAYHDWRRRDGVATPPPLPTPNPPAAPAPSTATGRRRRRARSR